MIQPNSSVVLGPIAIDGVPGSHWNIARTHLAPSLAPYEVTPDPSTPAVVWGGDVRLPDRTWRDTAFLLFADDAEALAALLAAGLASEVDDVPA